MEVRRTKPLMTYSFESHLFGNHLNVIAKTRKPRVHAQIPAFRSAEVCKSFLSPFHNFDNLDHCPPLLRMPFHG